MSAQTKLFSALYLIALVFIVTSCAPRPTASEAQEQLQALYKAMDVGLEDKNADQAVNNTASDFVSVGSNGATSSATQIKQGLGALFYHGSNIQQTTQIVEIDLDGNRASVDTKCHCEYNLINTTSNPVAGQSAHFTEDTTSVDSWTDERDGWVCHRSQTMTDNSTVNGQPIIP